MRAGSHRQAGPDLRAAIVAPGSTLSKRMLMLSHFHLYGELRFSGVMRRNGLLGLREDDDDDDYKPQLPKFHFTNVHIVFIFSY